MTSCKANRRHRINMTARYNFSAGPSMLPKEVLEQIHREVLDYNSTGSSILELGHRTQAFSDLRDECKERIRSLLNVPDNYDVIFCHGGGRMQFAMTPLNLLGAASKASYIVTGTWSDMAKLEAEKFVHVDVPFRSRGERTPRIEELEVPEDSAYLYHCDNETIHGVEFSAAPVSDAWKNVPLAADFSSSFMSRPIEVSSYGLIWAAAQKNFGIPGLTIAIIRRDLEKLAGMNMPYLLNYDSYVRNDSVANTPPIFQIYVSTLMARWIERKGGVEAMDEAARERSRMIYELIDENPKLYSSVVDPGSRSRMNVVFRLPSSEMDAFFVREAAAFGLDNLAGHHSIGGIRASLYNAMPVEGAEKLAEFMKEFALRHRL